VTARVAVCFPVQAKFFSPEDQTGSGVPGFSYSMGSGGALLGI